MEAGRGGMLGIFKVKNYPGMKEKNVTGKHGVVSTPYYCPTLCLYVMANS
jgi:hypothetical protein